MLGGLVAVEMDVAADYWPPPIHMMCEWGQRGCYVHVIVRGAGYVVLQRDCDSTEVVD